MASRRTRRHLRKLTPQPNMQVPSLQSQPLSQSRWWQCISAKSVGAVLFSAVSFVATVYSFLPSLEVSPSFQTDPSRPYSEVFVISNTGMSDLYNLEFLCVQDWLKDAHGNSAEGGKPLQTGTVSKLGSGDKTSIQCKVAFTVEPPTEMLEAMFSITINYQTFLPIYTGEKTFHFLGARTTDGTMKWTPTIH
jgi:hypothetical protein